MIIIMPPEYHGRKCNVCGEKDACCEINFRNDHHNHGIVVALCRDCVSHGRLIDADALCDGLVSNHPVVIHANAAPTIIPADPPKEEE